METSAGVAGKDIISTLPDEILHLILSFLNMACVMKTCILSKRWRYLWKTLPYLTFEYQSKVSTTFLSSKDFDYFLYLRNSSKRFKDFIDKVLRLRNLSTGIHTFRLTCHSYSVKEIRSSLSEFIQYALSHNVEVLDMAYGYTYSSLFRDLSTSYSLKTLKVRYWSCGIISPSFGLPCLEYMHLQEIYFVRGEDIGNLISGCPVLETLIIVDCELKKSDESLTISSPQLKHLEITRFKCNNMEPCNLLLSTPKLVSFSFHSYSCGNFFSQGLYNEKIVRAKFVIKLLSGLANVRSLTFRTDDWLFKSIFEGTESLHTTFRNLIFLKLTMSQLGRGEICAIARLLEKCPNIERFKLEFHKGEISGFTNLLEMLPDSGKLDLNEDEIGYQSLISDFIEDKIRHQKDINYEAAKFPSQFKLLHLKHIEIRNAVGCEKVLELVQFLRENTVRTQRN